ncbi:serine--tRNA ligase [Candidatus Berkelbacteria bacterium]|nr:serine--tRNA ligase [Candidatus Berkelbacteria bacterium]MBI4029896.1 serine--tRNA ligase [Candidatus Berkelbacteria bacterium]
MLDLDFIRQNKEKVKKALSKKHLVFALDEILKLDEKRRALILQIEKLRALRNKLSLAKQSAVAGRKIKEKLRGLEPQLKKIGEELLEKLNQLPNLPADDVPPLGKNQTVKVWGKIPKFSFSGEARSSRGAGSGFAGKPKDHLELGEKLGIIDTKAAAKISGSRFGYLKGKGALLELALWRFVWDLLVKKGFTPVLPPVLVKEEAMYGTGFFPAERVEYYKMADDDLYLAGTAEVPLAGLHMDEVLAEKDLPLKYTGFSTCFRREAGSYGKDTRGIFRVHQFDKIEMFVFAQPQNSWPEFEKLVKINEEIFQALKLPYRLVNIAAGELGAPNVKKYDLEVWLPSQKEYRELVSTSHDTDFQARRLNIKYRDKAGKTSFVHTLNSTAMAMGRTIVAILENYQQKDGSVSVPKALVPYTGFEKIGL